MNAFRFLASYGLLLGLSLLGACGGDGSGVGVTQDGGTGGSGGQTSVQPPANCQVLDITKLSPAQVPGFFTSEVSPKGMSKGILRVELNQKKGVKQTTGTFPLDIAPDDNYETCNHCVTVFLGESADAKKAEKIFIQAKGSMTLDAVSTPLSSETKGSITGVVLYESTLDPISYKSTKVSGGACLFVASATWDGTIPAGKACETAPQCGDTSTKVCDPKTQTCIAAPCGGSKACPSGELCVRQVEESGAGACYPACTPFSSTCSNGAECVPYSFDQSDGYCVARGTAKAGEACKYSNVATACAEGLVCASEKAGSFCRAQCDLTKATPQCPALQVCVIGSYCSTVGVDPAALGKPCDSTADADAPCGLNGKIAEGICAAEKTDGGKQAVCRKYCRMSSSSDCPQGQKCQAYYGTVGVCR